MDEEGFKGRYPGGPRRDPEGEERRRRLRRPLASVGDLEEHSQTEGRRRVRRRRLRRLLIGFLAVVLAAGTLGLWMGFRSRTTPEEMAEELNRSAQPATMSEDDRMLRELLRLQNQPQPSAAPAAPGGSRP